MPYALCLAGIPIALPHMLLLDEPTNHLDIESIEVCLSPYALCFMPYALCLMTSARTTSMSSP
jgi:ABC-type transport system involved in cytochrome bd biosynthesis fused ATPase/permease subunit